MTPCTAARQACLSITNSPSLLTLMSIESGMPSSHLILCLSFLLPPSSLSQHQGLFQWVNSSHQVAEVLEFQLQHQWMNLPMNLQDWFPLGWTGWISLQSKGLSRVFSNTTVQKHPFFSTQLSSQSNSHIHYWKTIALTRRTFVGKVMSLLLNMLSRLVIAFLPRSKHNL